MPDLLIIAGLILGACGLCGFAVLLIGRAR